MALFRRTPRTLRGHVVHALATAFVATGALAFVVAGSGGPDVAVERFDGQRLTDDAPPQTRRLMERLDCSATGYGVETTPRSAIVQRPSGRLAAVPFAEGWRVYTSEETANLVAVCVRPVP